MATAELISPLSYDGLDINAIREKFKTFCIDNGIIKDVNYLGSNISLQIDIISYAIQNINATAAMISNQNKISTATIRQNIIQLAQQIGYEITRPISSKMNITVSYPLTAGRSITIPAWSKWTCGDYTFLNQNDILLTNTQQSVSVDLIEGVYIDSSIDNTLLIEPTADISKFVLNYKNIEETSINMQVKMDGSTDWSDVWTSTNSLLDLTFGSPLFYEEYDSDTGWVNVYSMFAGAGNAFGSGDAIKFSFIITNGVDANGISTCKPAFKSYDDLGTEIVLNLTVNSASRGGQSEESDESIKNNAPLFYNTGNRTVNELDYQAFLEQSSLVLTANSWGGELHIPEKLGYIFFSVVPQDPNDMFISNLEEVELLSLLSNNRIVSTLRKFWQPAYFNVNFEIKILGTVPNIISRQTSINTILETHFTNSVGFKSSLYQNKLIKLIEGVFDDLSNASVVVDIKPKLLLAPEMFINNLDDTDMMTVFVPNSSKRYYLVKGTDRVNMPENSADLVSYYENGWVRDYQVDEDLDISFDAVLASKVFATGVAYVDGTITKKDLTYDSVVVGYFDVTNSIMKLNKTFIDQFVENVYLDVTYAPQFNVKFQFNSYPVLGAITYV